MAPSRVRNMRQVSAGGVVYRNVKNGVEVALIRVGEANRWQLPKGIVEADEDLETAALREVREETGVEAALVAPIDTIEYWYYGKRGDRPVRFHKFVHFFLLEYRFSGVPEEDREVIKEVRWVGLDEAEEMLAFGNEKKVLGSARDLIQQQS
jgi:8-oxo-dGTP pyrophosphatase MutT (NUDIX family)